MLTRYSFDIRVHSDFKRLIKPNRMFIVVVSANEREAFALATRTFQERTGSGSAILRYLVRGFRKSPLEDEASSVTRVIRAEARDWKEPIHHGEVF